MRLIHTGANLVQDSEAATKPEVEEPISPKDRTKKKKKKLVPASDVTVKESNEDEDFTLPGKTPDSGDDEEGPEAKGTFKLKV